MNEWKRGVTEANGEYVVFCDSDDYIDSGMIEALEEKINNFHVDIFFVWDADGIQGFLGNVSG